jgi:hypothetical protein
MFNFVIKLLATCIIEAPTGPDGNKIYPDLNRNVDDGVTVLPGKYNVHFIKRTDSLI